LKVEFGFQANCSELVTHLGMATIDSIAETMRRIEDLTGWTWRLQIDWRSTDEQKNIGEFRYLRLPMDDLESLLVFKQTDGTWIDIGIQRDKLLETVKEAIHLPRRFFKTLGLDPNDPVLDGCLVALVDAPADESVVWLNEDLGWPGIAYSCECKRKVFSIILSENEYIPALQAFHKIREQYATGFHGIGGYSVERYALWLSFNYLSDDQIVGRMSAYEMMRTPYYIRQRIVKHLKKEMFPEVYHQKREVVVKHVEEVKDCWRHHPPLEGTKPLSKEDWKFMLAYLRMQK